MRFKTKPIKTTKYLLRFALFPTQVQGVIVWLEFYYKLYERDRNFDWAYQHRVLRENKKPTGCAL